MSMPTAGQAAGKQPTDIAVKCATDFVQNNYNQIDSSSCTIIVTYDDWSTDVAEYNYKNGKLSGAASNIQLNGGYKAVTGCTIPVVFNDASNGDPSAMTVCLTAGLKTKPVDRPTTASVMQMPTTGAPEGLSSVGMVAVGLGLLAVGIGLVKRERI